MMVNMKSDPKESKDSTLCCPDYEPPAYPYGLQLSLCDESLQKLNMTELPKVGSVIEFTARATVTAVSQYETAKPDEDDAGSKERSATLQITDMDISRPAASAASVLYG